MDLKIFDQNLDDNGFTSRKRKVSYITVNWEGNTFICSKKNDNKKF